MLTLVSEPFIYGILAKFPPVYNVFVSTFLSIREVLTSAGTEYKSPSLDALCDSLIRQQEKLLHHGLIKNSNGSNKALVSQLSQGSKNLMKQHPKKNGFKQNNKGSKHDKEAQPNDKASQNNDKANKGKRKKIDIVTFAIMMAT